MLLERQRQCEQDRSFMVTAIEVLKKALRQVSRLEAERGKLLSARDDRLRQGDERRFEFSEMFQAVEGALELGEALAGGRRSY